MLDTCIRGGAIIDGTGAAARTADIGIRDGIIVEIGRITSSARRILHADGATVTPGFVDIHTHYDGQAMWDGVLRPSFGNGVTTAIFGNCGVGFAPVRDGSQNVLIDLMDAVEEIPGSALAEGLNWDWTSFPDYLDRLEARARTINIGALAPWAPAPFHNRPQDLGWSGCQRGRDHCDDRHVDGGTRCWGVGAVQLANRDPPYMQR